MSVGGTWGRILHVDLTDGEIWTERLPDEVYLKLVGGRGLVAYLLLRDLPAGVDPLGPDNLLIFAPGILQGSNLPGSGRHGVGAKSPLTGALASSEAGGWFGHEFKRTGYDALVVHGRSPSPVYLWIRDGDATIRAADHLWGRDTADVQAAIRSELGDERVRVAQCGVAGENEVLFASIMHDVNRAAGRNGLGAVMGSKNLKAVAVRGSLRLQIADREKVRSVSRWFGDNYRELSAWAMEIGTTGDVASLNAVGGLPTHNFRESSFQGAQRISGELMHETILIGRDSCQACPIRCKHIVEYNGEEYPDFPIFETTLRGQVSVDKVYGGPEYEALAAFGSDCGVDDLVAVAKANEMSARWGLDTISTGATIAFVMECVERGLLTSDLTGGFLPRWGKADDMLKAVDMIAHRRGFGDLMALGTKRLARIIGGGAERYAVEVKGQEVPMHDPRLEHALGVGYAVAPVGADHMMNMQDTFYSFPGDALERVGEVQRIDPLPPSDLGADKMKLFYHEVNWRHFQDCAVTCMFYPYRYSHLAEALSGVTGHDYTPIDLLTVGERAQTLGRLFNLREGFTDADDRLPTRLMDWFEAGASTGKQIDGEEFLEARRTWYRLMGWTPEGVPTAERLKRLELQVLLERIWFVP